MNAEAELLSAYRDWHRLVQAEGRAIQTHNWELLAGCHLAIKDFQSVAGRLLPEVRAEWRRDGRGLAEKEKNLQALLAGLLDLTRENQERLRATRAAAREQLDRLGQAGTNLRRLHRVYGIIADGYRSR